MIRTSSTLPSVCFDLLPPPPTPSCPPQQANVNESSTDSRSRVSHSSIQDQHLSYTAPLIATTSFRARAQSTSSTTTFAGFGGGDESAVSHTGNTIPRAQGQPAGTGAKDAEENTADTKTSKTDVGARQTKSTPSSIVDDTHRESSCCW